MTHAGDPTYAVVVNDARQHSIWDVSRALPAGWWEEGFRGSERECLAHIDAVWTEMRPVTEQGPARNAVTAPDPANSAHAAPDPAAPYGEGTK